MNDIGKPERKTQRRVIALLGDWTNRLNVLDSGSCEPESKACCRKKNRVFFLTEIQA